LKSLPFPSSLSTQIFPPSFSTNSLQRINPKPKPFSFAVPTDIIFADILNSFWSVSSFIPTPLSEIDISTWFCSWIAKIFISPSGFVNLIAFEIEVSNIFWTIDDKINFLGLKLICPVWDFAQFNKLSSKTSVFLADEFINPKYFTDFAISNSCKFSTNNSENPIIPLKGLRKSWAIIENSLSLVALSFLNWISFSSAFSFAMNNLSASFSFSSLWLSSSIFATFNSSTRFSFSLFRTEKKNENFHFAF